MTIARVGGLFQAKPLRSGFAPGVALAGCTWLCLVSCGGSSRQEFPAGTGPTPGGGGAKDNSLTAGRNSAASANGGNATNGGSAANTGGATTGGRADAPLAGTGGSAGHGSSGATSGAGTNTGATSGASSGAGSSAAGFGCRGSAGSAGTRDNGGSPASGEGGGGTGSSVGGDGPKPGFACYGTEHCDAGERCVDCTMVEITLGRCAPDPDRDPSGYAAATANCLGVGTRYSDCDGPEDCAHGQYCVVAGNQVGGQCQAEPAPEPASCCFTCDATPVCTLCWVDNDCPMGFLCGPVSAAPNDVGGCRPAL